MRNTLLAAAAVAGLALASSANADDYNFSYTTSAGPSGVESGSGVIDISNTASSNGGFAVTGITGEANGSAITGLSPYAASDNEVFISGPVVDLGGISASTASGVDYNFFYNGSNYAVLSSAVDAVGYPSNGSVVSSFNFSAVPESGVWTMMLAGIAMMGASLRFNRKRRFALAA